MKPYNKLTILRNRRRVRDLRLFRDLVDTYFERVDDEVDGLPADWHGVQAARSQINRMLPRMIQVIDAAGLHKPTDTTTDPGLPIAKPNVLRKIFDARFSDGTDQEILDIIDMALGVYEHSHMAALARTVNPFHYAITALAFTASLPRRALLSLGLWPRRRSGRIKGEGISRLEAATSRLEGAVDSMEARVGKIRDEQARQFAETSGQLAELAERLDFTERVLAQQRPVNRLESPEPNDVETPV